MAAPGQGFPTRPSMMVLLMWIILSMFLSMHTHGLPHRTLENEAFESIDPINEETRSDDTESTTNNTYDSSSTFPIESVAAMLRHFYHSSGIDSMAQSQRYNAERLDDNDDVDRFQDSDTSLIIENALPNGELLDPESLSQISSEQISRIVQRDTSTHQGTHPATSGSHESGISPSARTGQRRIFSYQDDSNSATTESQAQSDGKIIFPDDDMIVPSISPKFGIDPMCAGQTFCEHVPDYPEHLINQAIRRDGRLKMWEVEDELTEVVQRIDDLAGDEVLLCRTSEQVVRPKAALNRDNQWVFMVNQPNLKQALKIETCNNENARCEVIDGFADGYQTSCKQKYIYRPVATYKIEPNDSTTIDSDSVRLPSSCCCHVKFVGHPLLRMGFGMGQTKESSPKSASPTTASRRRRGGE